MEEIINAENAVVGRLCSYAAKQALQGKEIIVVNCEKAIITGNKKVAIEKYRSLFNKGGHSLRGPKIERRAYRILKRTIRGMLPDFREGIGREAFKRVKCYDGMPSKFENKEMKEFKTEKNKFITLKQIAQKL